jgi:hypothetical protein
MTLKQFKFFLILNPIFRVQITIPGKKKYFLCAKDDLMCEKTIFPFQKFVLKYIKSIFY